MASLPLHTIKLNQANIKRHFPNLVPEGNFKYTSPHTDEYNCVAWASAIADEWIQFIYDEKGNYDINVRRYINYFAEIGFAPIDNSQPEKNILKIAIYADKSNDFTHVARQLPSGKWTSKIGDWEDIEHDTLDDIAGGAYGKPVTIMAQKININ
ncbi:MAG: hypothetical protein H7257_08310 [Taibaiella sp.]|nr:hypothetical protein [Taibaiella sp.]